MKKIILFILLIILPLLYLLYCSKVNSFDVKKDTPNLILNISKEHRDLFSLIKKNLYLDKEIRTLFSKMNEHGNELCSMIYRYKKFNLTNAAIFINPKLSKNFQNKVYKSSFLSLVAGCWNFFVLNDSRPDIDFRLVKKLYNNNSFDCYSVGFLQPYIMHNELKCSSLTMLDIDWRILEGHDQLISLYRNNRFSSLKNLDSVISQLTLKWIAHSERYKLKNKTPIDSLCQRHQHSLCKNHLLKFQKNIKYLKRIQLNLAGLHSGNFIKLSKKNTIVVFLSNAIEKIYTTKSQFQKMLSQVSKNMEAGEKAILIYHVGGRSQFGIYELIKNRDNHYIKTTCKDTYKSSTVNNKEPVVYKTYFENFTITKGKIPACKRLINRILNFKNK
ncbi:hypothetical protein ACFL20_10915 [Spirochaetota bacterium]